MKNISRGYIFNALRKALRIKRRRKHGMVILKKSHIPKPNDRVLFTYTAFGFVFHCKREPKKQNISDRQSQKLFCLLIGNIGNFLINSRLYANLPKV